MDRVDEHPGLGATCGFHDPYGFVQRRNTRPWSEFEIHQQPVASSELAQAGEQVGEEARVGLVPVDDCVGGTQLRRRFEDGLEIRTLRLLPQPENADVEHAGAGGMHARQRFAAHPRIADHRVLVLPPARPGSDASLHG
ncbi:MAG: hypothetical protein ACM338_11485 [Betaproteobacteria bacterium]